MWTVLDFLSNSIVIGTLLGCLVVLCVLDVRLSLTRARLNARRTQEEVDYDDRGR